MTDSRREFSIIQQYFAGLITTTSPAIVLGPGDDCGIFSVPAGQEVCISTDTLTAGVHFPLDAAPAVVAHRALVANLSDLSAMGACPLTCTLALTLDAQSSDVWLAPFADRLRELIDAYAIPLIGGNLSSGPLSLTFTVLGTVPAGRALRRDGAQIGDDVYVTGHLGNAAGGLAQLQGGGSRSPALLERYQQPTPRLATGMALRGTATGAIDISDGLLADLGHVAEGSDVGIEVALGQLPLSDPLLENFDLARCREFALAGGDDYELAFTAGIAQRQSVAAVALATQVEITRIGRVFEGDGVRVVAADGQIIPVARHGYAHF